MKRIKQKQHIKIQEKSQQLKFRMQTEIHIDKHHALCQASGQLEELDDTKLYFTYSGIRKSQIEPRVLFKVLVYAYIKGVYSSRKIEELFNVASAVPEHFLSSKKSCFRLSNRTAFF